MEITRVGPKRRRVFCYIIVAGNGAAGQTTTKSFGDGTATNKYAEKLIQVKTGKGSVEVRPGR